MKRTDCKDWNFVSNTQCCTC